MRIQFTVFIDPKSIGVISMAAFQLDCCLRTVCGFLPVSDDSLTQLLMLMLIAEIALILELHTLGL